MLQPSGTVAPADLCFNCRSDPRVSFPWMSKGNGNQKPFEKMIIMKYDCVGIGVVKMTVGVRRRTHEKVQYCITALEI